MKLFWTKPARMTPQERRSQEELVISDIAGASRDLELAIARATALGLTVYLMAVSPHLRGDGTPALQISVSRETQITGPGPREHK